MARPPGSKNKTPQELKIEAEILKKKAENMELERKRKALAEQNKVGRMANKHSGVCPFCGDSVTPKLVEDNNIRRDVCECPSCNEKLLICRTPGCKNYAKGRLCI